MTLEVLDQGLLATIQDGGRPDAAELGVARSGACDPLALTAANLLLGNDPSVSAIELTLGTPELLVLADCVAALTGADLGIRIRPDGRWLQPGTSVLLRTGSRLVATAAPTSGCRTYLALAGGVDVPRILGSRSTMARGGPPGIGGRPLQAGDRCVPAAAERRTGAGHRWPGPGPSSGVTPGGVTRVVRVVEGPHARSLGADALDALLGADWTVGDASDRVGIRLLPTGPGATPAAPDATSTVRHDRDLPSFAMVWGGVEVPPDGLPIVLLPDGPTVGGYPVPLVVITADRPLVGQLRPGDTLRFVCLDVAGANLALREADAAWLEAASRLRAAQVVW